MSSKFHNPPSKLLGIDDVYWSWCIDEAVFMYGMGVEDQLNAAESAAPTQETKAGARMMKLKQLLEFDPFKPVDPAKPKFADPARIARPNRVKKVVNT